MPKKTLVIALLAIAVAIWWFFFAGQYEITNANPTGTRIIAFGDSLTSAYGLPRDASWVGILEERYDVEIDNAGRGGDTTATAGSRLDEVVLERDPKIVLLELGGNDLLQSVPRNETRQNLARMIERIHGTGAAVVLVAADGPLGAGGLERLMENLGQKHGAAVVPNILDGLMGKPQYMLDQVHPNREGHRIIADRVGDVLEDAFPEIFAK